MQWVKAAQSLLIQIFFLIPSDFFQDFRGNFSPKSVPNCFHKGQNLVAVERIPLVTTLCYTQCTGDTELLCNGHSKCDLDNETHVR